MEAHPLIDAYGRVLDNLRISVTRECNYSCIFCHLEGDPIGGPQKVGTFPPLLSPQDYSIVAEAATRIGISGFKITGGEPLVRKDIVEVISSISDIVGDADISMTTNGYLLEKYANSLRRAGLKRLNISIHSLRRSIYKKITGIDGLEKAIRGLEKAISIGFTIKINVSVVRGLNESEIWQLVDFARKKGVVLQLIELQPINSGARGFEKLHFPLFLIEKELIERGARKLRRKMHNRPIYILPDGAKVEIVKSYNNPVFCAGCNRVRLLSNGMLIPCINWKGPGVSLFPGIRGSSREKAVESVVEAFIRVNSLRKPYALYQIYTKDYVSNGKGLRLAIPKKGFRPLTKRELASLFT
ncbi:MAG: GTP 3',8-cyclase MoaA [Caldisphaeraceae archaeon]|nr:GTP 3',8-cyclase MoaA [Caldisphaeraceae archaeon]MEB3692143.1 GTP 3',8-cyclase MoaA [Caldisphaeraceae archaeon]MEB3797926.1 GTP 3',8-cyclase MoaA [Caldisphaeraceae archaeon]